jgi:predicted RNA binding protein YcfA (HicA-like mRNA interferase family)
MVFSKNVWQQLKNITADDLIQALKKDGYEKDPSSRDATIAFIKKIENGHKRIVIHYHPGKTYGPALLKALLDDIGWSESDMRRLKLIR